MSSLDGKESETATVPEKPVLTFKQMAGTEMVDLYVGPENEHFRVHKAAICSKIPYFDKMFNGGFEEAYKSSATFPEDKPEAFDLLLGWVYHGSIKVPEEKTDEDGLPVLSWSPHALHKLAEKLCLPHLQDQVVI